MPPNGNEAQDPAEFERLRERLAELEREPRHAALLRSILESEPDVIITLSLDFRIVFVNRNDLGGGALGEERRQSVLGASAFEFLDRSSWDVARAAFERVIATGKATSYEARGLGAHGPSSQYLTHVAPVVRDGRVEALTLVCRDVTEERATELALRANEERLRLAFEATNMGLYTWDVRSDDFRLDENGCRLYGFSPDDDPPSRIGEIVARIHPDDLQPVQRALTAVLRDGPPPELVWRIVRPDGQVRWILSRSRADRDERGAIVRLYGGLLDITRRKELEAQLFQSQKMEAVGQLTAGIAHNFNNMLAAIVSNLALAKRRASAEARPFLQSATEASQRAADLVRQLLVFSSARSYSRQLARVIAADLVSRTVDICRSTFQREIEIRFSALDDRSLVEVDETQLEQALLNLCLNARDAMLGAEHLAPHRLEVEVTRVPAGAPELRAHGDARDRDHVRVRVSDSGRGMDEATRQRIFEPFFTTKEVNKGTGLGLSTAFAIVTDHHGFIDVESALDRGSHFSIYLPVASSEEGEDVQEDAEPEETRGTETILVVDDERLVRRAVGMLLSDGGYRVLEAEDGASALEIARNAGGEIDLILLDQSMPILSGPRVLARLRDLVPGVPVVLFTGYADEEASGVADVLRKPVDPNVLLDTVRRLLDGR